MFAARENWKTDLGAMLWYHRISRFQRQMREARHTKKYQRLENRRSEKDQIMPNWAVFFQNSPVRKYRGTKNITMKPITIKTTASPFPPPIKILLFLSWLQLGAGNIKSYRMPWIEVHALLDAELCIDRMRYKANTFNYLRRIDFFCAIHPEKRH